MADARGVARRLLAMARKEMQLELHEAVAKIQLRSAKEEGDLAAAKEFEDEVERLRIARQKLLWEAHRLNRETTP